MDANSAHELSNRTLDGLPVLRWLLDPKRRAALILGRKLARELDKAGLGTTLVELNRAGRLHRVVDDMLERHEEELKARASCVSDDPHVVALTLMTGCTLVFTKDRRLHKDLKSHSRPGRRVAIYQKASHARLLTSCDCM